MSSVRMERALISGCLSRKSTSWLICFEECSKYDPKERSSLEQILHHPWFTTKWKEIEQVYKEDEDES
ncbi:hypothetical protein BJY01DRAFT_221355 [Aspergillus pseudoustus]|uniref:Protein kinase domain-containing protein n=1 Tax=Aspergillus pseudoustus TaxID=1810923 RepID=A0ABR4JDK6_9EURO